MKVPMLFKNKYVLYSLLLIGVVNVLGYIALEDYNSMALIIVLGVLSSYFSKNMSVNLLIAIVGTSLVAINNKITEGFVEGAKGKTVPVRKNEEGKKENKSAKEQSKKKKIDDRKEKEVRTDPKVEKKKKQQQQQQQRRSENKNVQGQGQGKLDDEKVDCQARGKVCKLGKNKCTAVQCGFQNNVPPSSPASVDGTDETDESIGKRIDYASTMEQAYDNLQAMLGEGGMKGLTSETKKLVSQQKNLMSTLNSMAPVLNTAKETLEGMNLPDMGEITTLMKKFTGGGSKKEKKKV